MYTFHWTVAMKAKWWSCSYRILLDTNKKWNFSSSKPIIMIWLRLFLYIVQCNQIGILWFIIERKLLPLFRFDCSFCLGNVYIRLDVVKWKMHEIILWPRNYPGIIRHNSQIKSLKCSLPFLNQHQKICCCNDWCSFETLMLRLVLNNTLTGGRKCRSIKFLNYWIRLPLCTVFDEKYLLHFRG